MSRQERIAWLSLAIFAAAIALFITLFVVSGVVNQTLPLPRRLTVACAAFAVYGLFGITPWMFRGDKTRITEDERDRFIVQRSAFIAHLVFWVFFVLVNMGIWSWGMFFGHPTSVPVGYLPLMVWGGWTIVELTRAIVTLTLYRRGVSDAAL